MKIALTILGYKNYDFLCNTIEQIQKQLYSGEFKTQHKIDIIIALDKSPFTDYIRFNLPYDWIEVLPFDKHYGIHLAPMILNNIIFSRQSGDALERYDVIWRIDDDLILSPSYIQIMLNAFDWMEAQQKVGILSSPINKYNREHDCDRAITKGLPAFSNYILHRQAWEDFVHQGWYYVYTTYKEAGKDHVVARFAKSYHNLMKLRGIGNDFFDRLPHLHGQDAFFAVFLAYFGYSSLLLEAPRATIQPVPSTIVTQADLDSHICPASDLMVDELPITDFKYSRHLPNSPIW